MPFGKKVLTPKAHTKGVGDEQHIQGALDFLVRSRLMSLPEDDSPATREQRQAGFVEAEEFFKRLEWMQPCNSQVFRLVARFRFHMQQPASEAVTRVLDLEGSESVGWLLAGVRNGGGEPGGGHSDNFMSGSPATDRVLGEISILDQLRDNVEVDERGLATLLRALELIRESHPDLQKRGARMAFHPTINDEIGAVKQYMAALDLVSDDCAHPAPEYVAPLPLESQDLFETWAPPEAVERWGFIIAAFCTQNLKAKADTLRRSLQQFGMPHTFQEVSTVHPTLSSRGVGGPALTKPNFIHAMLERHQLPVLYMDCDLVVMDEPVHVHEALRGGYDWGICNFLAAETLAMSNPLPGESNRYSLTVNCDGLRFLSREQLFSNGAINIWNNTEGARRVLRRWHQELVFFTNAISFQVTSDPANGVGVWTVAEDNVLDWLWNNRSKLYQGELLDVKPYWLPLSYARLPIWSFVAPIVNHPDFLSAGPRMQVAAHRGTRKAHYDNSSPQKSWAALRALGIPRGCIVFDMEKRMAGRRTQEGGEIQYDIEIKDRLYPPGMVEWGALGGPEYVWPLPLESQYLFETWAPPEAVERGGIPNIIHFIFGLQAQDNELMFCHYVSVYSALVVNNPDKIYFYYHHEPFGPWWEKMRAIDRIEFVKVEIPTHIGAKPLFHTAHKADKLRMDILFDKGGIYMDIDTISVRPYAHLLQRDVVLGIENHDGQVHGICNAVMMTIPQSRFFTIWMKCYERYFNTRGWEEASIKLPWDIARKYGALLALQPADVFFEPSWGETEKIFVLPYEIPTNLVTLHLWEKMSMKYLEHIKDWSWADQNSHTLYGKLLLRLRHQQ